MATKKISEFTTLGSLSDTDILPVVNAGSNKKITGATLKTYAQSGLTIPTDVSDLTDTTGLLSGGSTLLEPYKGFRAHYGSMYDNNDEEEESGPINKLVIYKSTYDDEDDGWDAYFNEEREDEDDE
jgi:hypothetical protein